MECNKCAYYDKDEGYCMAFTCDPNQCDEELPCEDGVTLYAERSKECERLLRGS